MNKKAQEEMVGFIMIVVLVTIILLVFLAFIVRSPSSSSSESVQVSQFLESAMEYTTDCAIGYIPAYARVGELLRECNRNILCLEGERACEVLNETLSNIIESSFKLGENRPLKGYIFEANYALSSNNSAEREILFLSEGTCEGRKLGAEYLSPASPGIIVSRLEICY